MNTSKGRAQSAREPRSNNWPSAADCAAGLVAHDFVGPTRTFMYVHCRNCELIFKPLQGRGPCPGPAQPLNGRTTLP